MKLSIQQQELTNNIKKLAKGLKSFSLSDINLMLPNNDKDINFCIKYLISKNIIKETANDSYIYIEQKVSNDISISDKLTLLDFKTSKNFYSSMFLQLGAYITLLEEAGYDIDQVAILIINEN